MLRRRHNGVPVAPLVVTVLRSEVMHWRAAPHGATPPGDTQERGKPPGVAHEIAWNRLILQHFQIDSTVDEGELGCCRMADRG